MSPADTPPPPGPPDLSDLPVGASEHIALRLDWLAQNPRVSRTKAELDARIAEERESWND